MLASKDFRSLLHRTDAELVAAKRLLRDTERTIDKAVDKAEKRSAKYSRRTIKTAVEGLKQHRGILKEQTAK
jgi:predicted GNAT family N-acyltransferase